MEVLVTSEKAMEDLGARIAESCSQGALIFLRGELGAGKTTLVRGLLRRLGHQGAVKSPTYALVEAYEINGRRVYHLDLYRLQDPEELEYLGIREMSGEDVICLIEWPENGADRLMLPDLTINIHYSGKQRCVEITENTTVGAKIADLLQK